MRFFTSSLLAIAALASAVFAQQNPISKPDKSTPLAAGGSVDITWTPTTSGPITLKLRQGPSDNLKDLLTVVAGTSNSGSFTWTIPEDLPSGDNYAFQISDDVTNDLNFTPLLSIKSDVGPKSSSTGSATSSSATDSSSTSSGSSSRSSSATTTSKPEATGKHGHNNSTMITHTTAPSNGTTTSTGGYPSGTKTPGGSNSTIITKPSSSNPPSTPSSTGSSPPASTAPSSGAVALVMNSPLALVVCVLGAVMYLN